MTSTQDGRRSWRTRTVEIKVWKLVAVLIALPILVMWYRVVHQEDEILALIRNEVVTDSTGQRTWAGSFINTNSRTLRDVGVTVDFLDAQDQPVSRTNASAEQLHFGARLELAAPLPSSAVRLHIYSVQWRMDRTAADTWLRRVPGPALMGPFREPWEFGYLMVDPAAFGPTGR